MRFLALLRLVFARLSVNGTGRLASIAAPNTKNSNRVKPRAAAYPAGAKRRETA
jgi:hypothetical protein